MKKKFNKDQEKVHFKYIQITKTKVNCKNQIN